MGLFHDEAARSVLAKVWGDIFARFHAVAQIIAVEPRIHSLASWDKFFIKESDDYALDIDFHLSGLFWPW
jgi:hypothetical protein